jgi:Uma2 family endonuclease
MVTIEATITKDNLIRDLVPDNPLILYGVSWENYENLVRELDGSSVQMTYNRGILKIMSKSGEHEYYIEFLKQIVGILSRIIIKKVIHFGGPTIKKSFQKKGVEPDACFYVSRANLVSGRADVDVSEIVPDIWKLMLHMRTLINSKFMRRLIYQSFGDTTRISFKSFAWKMLTIKKLPRA